MILTISRYMRQLFYIWWHSAVPHLQVGHHATDKTHAVTPVTTATVCNVELTFWKPCPSHNSPSKVRLYNFFSWVKDAVFDFLKNHVSGLQSQIQYSYLSVLNWGVKDIHLWFVYPWSITIMILFSKYIQNGTSS